ncbi:MAG: recombinase family protein [Saprospiraceae bacterium]|jgi:DNA invertase Pin-like site-specific DNA recombinase|nr:recombinase family protein [Saprospiraceae bacterium]
MNVAIIVRVSSKSDRQEYDRQINDLTEIAKKNKWTVVKIVTAKISATKTPLPFRDDIAELYELVNAKAIQKVLVTELTRLGRKAKEIREVYEYLTDNNISIFIQSLGLDTGAKGAFQKAINNIVVTILAEIAELETVRLSQRIKSGIAEARRNGKILGRPEGSIDNIHLKIKTNPKYKTAAKALKDKTSLRKTAAFSDLSVNTVRKIKAAIEID